MPLDLDAYPAILLDLDGTVYHEEHSLPGAVELIRLLQSRGKKFACLTNSTSSPQRIGARLQRMGVELDPHHIYTAAAAACDYVLQHFGSGSPPRVFNLATEGVRQMLEGKVTWVESANDPCEVVITG